MAIEAVNAGRDAYVEKPTADRMADAVAFRDAVRKTGKIVQVGTQRRSTPSYQQAYEYIKTGKFGDINMVEMTLEREPARTLAAARRGAVAEGAGHGLEAVPPEPSV